jgi:hypothetical protein
MRSSRRTRALLAAALVVVAGLTVRRVASGAFAKYAGEALWATLVYTLLVALLPRARPRALAAAALAISVAVELFQLTPYPAAISAVHPFFHLVLGDTFHAPDLPAYAFGVALAWAMDRRG